MTADQILALAKVYAAATGKALSGVGVMSCGNDKIFTRLAAGRGCNSQSIERAEKWFAGNWPADVPWPEDIPAPRDVAA
jgi:hypothetical protein